MLESVFFNLFAGLSIVSGMGVVLSRNTMHSVMFLIFCFFNAAGLFFLLDAEFLGIILILIYVGAVMVLFMFVIMMLEVKVDSVKDNIRQYLSVGGIVAVLLLMEFIAASSSGVFVHGDSATAAHMAQQVNNTEQIGLILYTKYLLGFEIAAIILLVSLIGAVVLTIRKRRDAKYQNISSQVKVRREDRVRKVRM
jgi:NADH-quinone oxidoreductase subunit J